MTWLYLVILAQLISAFVVMIDKYLVTKVIRKPMVYTFYVGALSSVVLLLLPFGGIHLPNQSVVLIASAVAAAYILSILCLYRSLTTADASDIAPVMGAVTAISTFVFDYFILKTKLPINFFLGFPFLILGTFLMSRFRIEKKSTLFVVLAGTFFGLSAVMIKMIFIRTDFLNGFFWSRIANVIGAMALLAWPANFKAIKMDFFQSKSGTKFLIVFNKALAGIAFLLILIAIKLGDVSVVNALGGIQFIFVLLLAYIFTHRMPHSFHEAFHRQYNVLTKTLASALIIIGLVLLFL